MKSFSSLCGCSENSHAVLSRTNSPIGHVKSNTYMWNAIIIYSSALALYPYWYNNNHYHPSLSSLKRLIFLGGAFAYPSPERERKKRFTHSLARSHAFSSVRWDIMHKGAHIKNTRTAVTGLILREAKNRWEKILPSWIYTLLCTHNNNNRERESTGRGAWANTRGLQFRPELKNGKNKNVLD
jgi:hypothetical protein